jgi:hypothetical protein
VSIFRYCTRASVVNRRSADGTRFLGTGILSLIQPLYFVALIELNEMKVRSFAVQQLRAIALKTGVLQAALLADTAAAAISGQGPVMAANAFMS